MKTLNSKKPEELLQIFLDPKTKEYVGFAGKVELYKESVYIDTRTGQGYDAVIEKIMPLIHRFMVKFRFQKNTAGDTRQDIIVHILEGIPKYDPRKETKLSTFLEMRVNRRLINELRDNSRMFKNATFLNIRTYSISCVCGHDFITTINSSEEDTATCPACSKSIASAKKKVAINIQELRDVVDSYKGSNNEQQVISLTEDGEHSDIMSAPSKTVEEEVIFKYDLERSLEHADDTLLSLLELVCLEDYSISAAAEKIGISGAGANIKIKSLQKNRALQELLNKGGK